MQKVGAESHRHRDLLGLRSAPTDPLIIPFLALTLGRVGCQELTRRDLPRPRCFLFSEHSSENESPRWPAGSTLFQNPLSTNEMLFLLQRSDTQTSGVQKHVQKHADASLHIPGLHAACSVMWRAGRFFRSHSFGGIHLAVNACGRNA